jgi:hypothetical protein
MTEECNSILKNDVWEIVLRPAGKSVIDSRWLFKIKHWADGSIEKYKTRFVTGGLFQRMGVDYDKIFSLVARYASIRVIMSLLLVFGRPLY